MVNSDIGAFMMGQVVEHVSGEALDVYARRHIFEPLKMRETMFNPPESLWVRVAPTEIDSTRGGLMHGKVHDERAYYLGGVAAHAGLFSTASDVTRFVSMMLRGGLYEGVKVLGARTVQRMTAYADSGRHNRALGWQKPPAPWAGHLVSSRSYGHTGFTGTSILVDPENNVFVILLSNRVNPTRNNQKIGEVRARIADAVIGAVQAMHQPSTAGAP
jgi:CubicO group peptidase (beta-lactamase class C family)